MFFTIENPDLKLTRIREEQNRKLQDLDKAKDEFLSLASHQLRTPLTSLRGYATMLLDGDFGKLTRDQRHAVREIESSSERMIFLVRDLLDVSSLQAGNFTLERRKVNLGDLIDVEIDQLKLMAQKHTVKLTKENHVPDAPEINIDRERIGEVMANFIDNAIFYSPPNRTVTIDLSRNGNFMEFRVIDHGIGVPEKDRINLFTKFFRASNALTMRPDGTGIGLYLAKKIISEHGGEIIFQSEVGKGSTFGFRLPIK